LKRHISKVHESPNLYSCSICNQGFLKKNLIKNHVASVHEGKILFHCEICNIEFAKKLSLVRHTSNVHTEKFQENKNVEETIEIKTEYVEKYVVESKQENISNGELNNPLAVQIKTEMETGSALNEDLILGV
jgi:uncharacterized C2H2 Zn-finger protein